VTIIQLPGFDRDSFLLGLSWRHLDSQPKPALLRSMAEERGEIYAVYHAIDAAWQAGFSQPPSDMPSDTKMARMYALAPLIAALRPAPWRAVFDIGNGLYWYLAVRDQQEIIPEGDFVGSIDAVSQLRSQHDAYGVWNDYDEDASLQGLADAVRNLAIKRKPVRRLTAGGTSKRIILASCSSVILLAVLAGGWWAYHNQQVAKQRALELARLRAAAEQNKPKPVIPPWFRVPQPDYVLDSCAELWRQQSLSTDGWDLSSWKCSLAGAQVSAEANYSRNGGLAENAPGALDPSGNKSVAYSSAALGVLAEDHSVMVQEGAQRRIWSFAQQYDLALNLGIVPRPQVLPGKEPPPLDPWVAQSVGLTLSSSPWDLGLQFDAVPGLRVSSVTFDGAVWSVQAQLYSARQNGAIPLPTGAT
jgi:Pilin accessory protein (PilO).